MQSTDQDQVEEQTTDNLIFVVQLQTTDSILSESSTVIRRKDARTN